MSSSNHGQPAIEVSDASYSYAPGHPVLMDIDLEVEQGDFLAIIGPNGGGKSTLLKLILGLIRPDKGRIRVFGDRPEDAREDVGYVPQLTTFNPDFPLSALDVVLMGRLGLVGSFRRYSSEDLSLAREYMDLLGISDLESEKIGHLSGGQRQRVFIARALATEPRLLLLDEPAASVDPTNQESFYSLLSKLNRTVTVVMATHDVGAVSSYVKTIACLNVRLASHGEGLDHKALQEAYGCPIELIAHGVPHRILGLKKNLEDGDD
ncbi:ATP-binding cassette domain-containing protein [Candidatus Fermentibacteria bacterium]|nr:ATP-binding cassette domain-containing protein [Candidatus Fermentibacteria bacterium]